MNTFETLSLLNIRLQNEMNRRKQDLNSLNFYLDYDDAKIIFGDNHDDDTIEDCCRVITGLCPKVKDRSNMYDIRFTN